jgi:hypothetical protein
MVAMKLRGVAVNRGMVGVALGLARAEPLFEIDACAEDEPVSINASGWQATHKTVTTSKLNQ